jgi:NAD(P)H-hydrate epimerase
LPVLSPPRARNAHKGKAGHVLCIGGDAGKGGAILLCVEAALRSGCGLASVATLAVHVPALLARRPEAMAHGVETVEDLAPLIDAADVLAIGPGLGRDAWGRGLLEATLGSGKPMVLDADALNLVAESPSALPPDTILTPHPGEAGRLLGIPASDIQSDRFSAVEALCERFRCVVVLKGAGTLVAMPGRVPDVLGAGNPGMAVGGMGDVLTGVIAGLRAQGHQAFDAARFGALLHACAGDRAAGHGGERGLLASDLMSPLRELSNS